MGHCRYLVTSEQHTELYVHVVAKSENSLVICMMAAEHVAAEIKYPAIGVMLRF
jgi:hypothetical protein